MTNIITNKIIDPIKVDLKPNHAKYRKYTSTQSLPICLSFLHYSNKLNESKEIIQNFLAKAETMENKMNNFEQLVNEGVEHRLEPKVTEHSLCQRNEILQEEVDKFHVF